MTATQHTEATRKKLREAAFFLHLLATVNSSVTVETADSPEPEAADFYLNAFLSAARAVQETLRKERKKEFKAWIEGWVSKRTDEQRATFSYLNKQRTKVVHEGQPDVGIVYHVSPRPGNAKVFPSGVYRIDKVFNMKVGQSLAAACQPLYDVMKDLVVDFERDHPPT